MYWWPSATSHRDMRNQRTMEDPIIMNLHCRRSKPGILHTLIGPITDITTCLFPKIGLPRYQIIYILLPGITSWTLDLTFTAGPEEQGPERIAYQRSGKKSFAWKCPPPTGATSPTDTLMNTCSYQGVVYHAVRLIVGGPLYLDISFLLTTA